MGGFGLDVVLIWALDRLSREGISNLTGYLEQLKEAGVRVMSHEEPWLDTGGPCSDLLVAIFGWIAKQERERISARVKAGQKRAKESGKKIGRPKKRNDFEIRELRAEGMTIRQIAQLVGLSSTAVQRAIK